MQDNHGAHDVNGNDSVFPLDGPTATLTAFTPELERQRAIVTDTGLDFSERLEALEDIIESEVGDTDLTRARNLERQLGLRQVYLKFEGGNPSGTQKDRIAFAQVMDALRRGFDTITIATCGNYGSAIALAAELSGLRSVIYIPDSYHTKRLAEMQRGNVEIRRVPGDYEAAVDASREQAERDELYDANAGGENTILQLKAYGEIAYELYDELRDAPAAIAVPVSNGTTLAGIHRGFVSLYRRGRTSRIPRMIAGSSFRKNPIVEAFRTGAETCGDLAPGRIRETAINEPLVNWHSIDGDLALDAIRATDGFAADISDRAMLAAARNLREQQGLSVMPAATAGLVALTDLHQHATLPGDRYVVILTGRR